MARGRRILVEIAGDASQLLRAFKQAGRSGDSFGRKMSGVAKGAIGLGASMTGLGVVLGVKSVRSAAKFETSMSRIEGLAGQSRKQVKEWGNELLSLGPQLGKTPQELADALYFVASSGVAASKAIGVVTVSAKASAAGLGETEVVADAVTSVMNAYADANMSAARATDVLVATVREGKGEADAFAGVIGNVAAFASRLKVPFEEVGAALAAMTQLGTDPRTAATQLQAFFSSMLKQTDKAQGAAKKVGLNFDQMLEVLQKKGLLASLKQIKTAFAGNTKAMAGAFPNIRALRSLLALTADDGGKVAGVFERMADSGGSLGTAWAAAEKTASLNMDRLKASLQTLEIAFGQGLLPVVTDVAKALAKKLADPKVVQTIRELGKEVGTKLKSALDAVSQWFDQHWGDIKEGFRTATELGRGTVSVVRDLAGAFQFLMRLGRPVFQIFIIQIKTLLGLFSGLARALSHLPFIGDKFGGVAESIDKIREATRGFEKGLTAVANAGGGGGGSAGAAGHPGRARGGPVMPGVAYRVGERGPETFVPSTGGTIVPNGGGGGDVVINLDGREIARVALGHLQRMKKNTTSQTRGKFGGNAMAF